MEHKSLQRLDLDQPKGWRAEVQLVAFPCFFEPLDESFDPIGAKPMAVPYSHPKVRRLQVQFLSDRSGVIVRQFGNEGTLRRPHCNHDEPPVRTQYISQGISPLPAHPLPARR